MTKAMLPKNPRIAVIGATGIAGRELIRILEERNFPLSTLQLFASARSAGEIIDFRGEDFVVNELKDVETIDADLAFFAAGSAVSLNFVEKLSKNGVICIDKSSAFRMREDVPLMVPEVNGHLLRQNQHRIIAVPNCITTPLVQVLKPINEMAALKSVIIDTYQAVSGAGKSGTFELETQVRDLFNLRETTTEIFGKRIAFNVLPVIPARPKLDTDGKTEEEAKAIAETKKILNLKSLKMDATCVRVPVFNGHSIAVHLETVDPIKIDDAVLTLSKSPGIILIDNPQKGSYPTPLDASGEDLTLVGRIRPNTAAVHGLSLWISCDNLRTGAALNAVRIAETVLLEQN